MVLESYKKNYAATCPGSLMILGEHAVLHGSPCVVAAIDKSLTVNLQLQSKKKHIPRVIIDSDINLNHQISFYLDQAKFIGDRVEYKKYRYVLAVIHYFKIELSQLDFDFNFTITSDINPTMGLGSSAAVTCACIAVILDLLDQNVDKQKILKIGYEIINQVQGKGSGADLAASIYGGVISYQVLDHQVQVITDELPLCVVYSGYKLSTQEVIRKVALSINKNGDVGDVYCSIFALITKIVMLGINHLKNKNWPELGRLFNMHYGLQESLGTSDTVLANIVHTLRSQEFILGAKISGSGLGDCVIGLGSIGKQDNGLQYLDIKVTNCGLVW